MNLFTELRRRNVFKIAVAYAVVAWVLVQVVISIKMPLHLEQKVVRLTFLIWRSSYSGTRRLPGFKNLLRDIGLVDFWRATGRWPDLCTPVGEDDFECR